MVRMWILFFVGLAWPTTEAYDEKIDAIANKVLKLMNDTAGSVTAIQSYSLSGFNIKFTVRAEMAEWFVQDGRVGSNGSWTKTGTAALHRSANNLYLSFPFSVNDFRSNYTFHCSNNNAVNGTFDMSIALTYHASIKFKITFNQGHYCNGAVDSIDLREIQNCEGLDDLNFDGKGVDGDGVLGKCAYFSYNQQSEYLIPFQANFCASYYDGMKTLILQTATAAVQGFNFCPS